ncbi:acetyltransferase [Pilimelia columellifera]|uniref:dTDP-4-amino-4,6-dideoxy-D-glucose acetyltransferase VioB n=1 Tax=Pilimelia columellifera subsp. columellifera TaxID=706583 RepID=A0ABP6A795_9ACTN
MTEKLVIVGAGALGREVFQYVGQAFPDGALTVAGFLDDRPGPATLPAPLLGPVSAVRPDCRTAFLVAVGQAGARAALAATVTRRGGVLATLIHPKAHVAPDARIGPGSLLCPFSFVGAGARVGANTVLNTFASVAHDSITGAHCVFSPYATVNGSVTLGEAVFLGTHATVVPGRRIGPGARISAGAVVFSDVPAGHTVAGNPALERITTAV